MTWNRERYECLGRLGKCGMAEVDLCRDHRLGRDVARKQLLPRLQDREECKARFEREIRLQTELEHPSVVPLFDRGLGPDGREFFTMRRVGGITLAEGIRSMVGVPDPLGRSRERARLVEALLRACLVLDYAHERGVIHRDIKPDNFMLGHFGELYVLDWGIARIRGETGLGTSSGEEDQEPGLTGARHTLGTQGYMSPGQERDPASADARSDVYALGVVLFEVLTGQRPQIEGRRPHGEQLHPSRRAPGLGIPPEYDAICARACDPRPERRYQTARALHDAIEAVAHGNRDQALRQGLALEHLRRATQSEDPVVTLREAGRALALDPHNRHAADLLAQKLLAPPEADPPELEEERARTDRSDARRALLTNAGVACALLLLTGGAAVLSGVRSWGLLLGAILPALAATGVLVITRADARLSLGAVLRSLAVGLGFGAPIALSATVAGPWVLPPALAAVVCTVMCSVVAIGWRRALVAGCTLASLGLGLMLGEVQVGPEAYTVPATMVGFDAVGTPWAVGTVLCSLVLASAAVVGRNTDALLESRRRLHRVEWRLRQMAPRLAEGDQSPRGSESRPETAVAAATAGETR